MVVASSVVKVVKRVLFWLPEAAQVGGGAAGVVALWLWDTTAGLAGLGVLLLTVGVLSEVRRNRKTKTGRVR